MSSIHLYLHRILIRSINPNVRKIDITSDTTTFEGVLTRKRALWYISKYLCNFAPMMKKEILNEMIQLKLLKEKGRYWVKIINFDKSAPENIDSGLLLKILESGGEK